MSTTRRGIVLLSALFIVLIVGVVLRAILAGAPGSLTMAAQSSDVLGARRAAEAGVSYARMRLREDPDWRGTGDSIDRPDFKVVESEGNVYGLLVDLDGARSSFRLRFNFQEGAGGADGMNDPSLLMDLPFVSLNNLNGSAGVVLPRAGTTSPWAATGGAGFEVPEGSVALVVEGRTGPGLKEMTDPLGPPSGPVYSRRLQVLLSRSLNTDVSDASMMTGGDLVTYGGALSNIVTGTGTPRLRSKGGVSVLNADGSDEATLDMDGEVGRNRSSGLRANVSGTIDQKNESVGDSKDFYNLKWSDVETADASPASDTAVQIPGGTYVVSPGGTLVYYDMDFPEYKSASAMGAVPGGVSISSLNLSELRTPTNLSNVPGGVRWFDNRLEITSDLAVVPSSTGTRDLVITPAEGHPLGPTDTTMQLGAGGASQSSTRPTINIQSSTVSVPGDATLLCDVDSNDSAITVEGDAVVSATSVVVDRFDPPAKGGGPGPPPPPPPPKFTPRFTQNQGLSLYVKRNLTLSSYQPAPANWTGPINQGGWQGYGDLQLEGLLYVWGDVTAYAGDLSVPSGKLSVRGALVAYGADPGTGRPGASGRGRVEIHSGGVDLNFDSAMIAGSALSTALPTILKRGSYDFNP